MNVLPRQIMRTQFFLNYYITKKIISQQIMPLLRKPSVCTITCARGCTLKTCFKNIHTHTCQELKLNPNTTEFPDKSAIIIFPRPRLPSAQTPKTITRETKLMWSHTQTNIFFLFLKPRNTLKVHAFGICISIFNS